MKSPGWARGKQGIHVQIRDIVPYGLETALMVINFN
jgi:hypothetical protein